MLANDGDDVDDVYCNVCYDGNCYDVYCDFVVDDGYCYDFVVVDGYCDVSYTFDDD